MLVLRIIDNVREPGERILRRHHMRHGRLSRKAPALLRGKRKNEDNLSNLALSHGYTIAVVI